MNQHTYKTQKTETKFLTKKTEMTPALLLKITKFLFCPNIFNCNDENYSIHIFVKIMKGKLS